MAKDGHTHQEIEAQVNDDNQIKDISHLHDIPFASEFLINMGELRDNKDHLCLQNIDKMFRDA